MTQPQLRVSFSGLCLFDFNPPLSGEVKPTNAKVLLQRLTRARPLAQTVNAQPEVLDQHFPLLEFNLADWSPSSTRKADFHCLPDATGKMTKGVCLLNGEDVTIHPDGAPEPPDLPPCGFRGRGPRKRSILRVPRIGTPSGGWRPWTRSFRAICSTLGSATPRPVRISRSWPASC